MLSAETVVNSCSNDNNGSISFPFQNSNYSYVWRDGPTGRNRSGLPGNFVYIVDVTDVSTGCVVTRTVPVGIRQAPEIYAEGVGTTISPSVCDNGSITLGFGQVTNPVFTWVGPGNFSSNGQNISGLEPGSYTVTVRGSNQCEETATFTVPAGTGISVTGAAYTTCFGQTIGGVEITDVSGGSGGYEFEWRVQGNPTIIFDEEDLYPFGAAIYELTVRDSEGCAETLVYEVLENPEIFINPTGTPVSCPGASDGSIFAPASGGAGFGYTYTWRRADGTPLVSNSTSPTLSGQPAGFYDLEVNDGENCPQIFPDLEIEEPEEIVIIIDDFSPSVCQNASDGFINVTVSGGTMPYSFEWRRDNQVISIAKDLSDAEGGYTYCLTVLYGDGCRSAPSCQFIGETDAPVIFSADPIAPTCSYTDDGSLFLRVSNVSTYRWEDASGTLVGTDNPQNDLAPGTYFVTVTSADGCTATGGGYVVPATAPILVSGVANDISCGGLTDGSIDLTVTNGIPNYQYTWTRDNQAYPAADDVMSPTDLPEGSYAVTVTDSEGCTETGGPFIINAPDLLGVNIVVMSSPNCDGGMDGVVRAEVFPAGNYTYSWNGGSPTTDNTFMVGSGQVTVLVTDTDSGCTAFDSGNVTQPTPVTVNQTANSPSSSCIPTGSATVTAAGGVGGYTFNWQDVMTGVSTNGNSSTASGLAAGDYTVDVTDANGCPAQITVTILSTNPIVVSIDESNGRSSCAGADDASLTGSATGGLAPLTLQWDGYGENVTTIENLSPGNYTFTVTDADGCVASRTVTVTEPDPFGANIILETQPSCNGATDGLARADIGGATGNFSYSWNNGAFSADDTHTQGAGDVSLVVRNDDTGCTSSALANFSQPTPVTLTSTPAPSSGCDDTGTATVTAAGGVGGYTFTWPSGVTQIDTNGNSSTASGLAAGDYIVDVTDANGCPAQITVTILATDPIVVSIDESNGRSSCAGADDASLTGSATGGLAPLTLQWSGYGENVTTIENLSPGNYTFTVTDADGCVVSRTVTVTEPDPITVTANPVDPTCAGDNDGSITLDAVGGGTVAGNYTYQWVGSGVSPSARNQSGLAAGTYTVTVSDDNGCPFTRTFVLTTPPALALSATDGRVVCRGEESGTGTVTVTTGPPPYTFAWPQNVTAQTDGATSTATGLGAGDYLVTVTDGSGCPATTTVTITQPDLALFVSCGSGSVTTVGGSDGTATIDFGGGWGGYAMMVDNQPVTLDGSPYTVSGLSEGDHPVVLTDSEGCTVNCIITIDEPDCSEFTIATTAAFDPACTGEATGTINLMASGNNGTVTYRWNDSPAPAGRSDLSAGTYTITAEDAAGCFSNTLVITLTDPPALSLDFTVANVSCAGEDNGSLTALPAGGTGDYMFTWSPAAPDNETINDLVAGIEYFVTVTDENGCTVSGSRTLTEPTVLLVVLENDTVSCNGANDGELAPLVSGGTPPYLFSWGDSLQQGLVPGLYELTVTDSSGCATPASARVIERAAFSIECDGMAETTFDGDDGVATITLSNGVAPFFVTGPNGSFTTTAGQFTINPLAPGTYDVTVTDANNCSDNCLVTIDEFGCLLDVTASVDSVSCAGADDGRIELTPVNEEGTVTILWSIPGNASFATGPLLTGLSGNTYTATISDESNCSFVREYTVLEPAALNLDCQPSAVTTVGGNDGSVNLVITGGTAPYRIFDGDAVLLATVDDGSYRVDDLTAGTYTYTVLDANDCATSCEPMVTEPGCTLQLVGTNDTICFGSSDGELSVSVTGNDGTPSYSWLDGPTGSFRTDLVPGSYTVTAATPNGCSVTVTYEVVERAAIELFATNGTTSGAGAMDGVLQLTITEGAPPFTLVLSGDADRTEVTSDRNFSWDNLPAGNYVTTLTDGNGCAAGPVSSEVFDPVCGNTTIADDLMEVSCTGGSDGSIVLTVSGDNGPWTYQWSLADSTGSSLRNLPAGSYSVTVTNQVNCDIERTYLIGEPASLPELTDCLVEQPATAGGSGSITLFLSGGTPPYDVYRNDTLVGADAGAMFTMEAVYDGTYVFTVTDANDCAATIDPNCGTVDIDELECTYPEIAIDVAQPISCSGATDGILIANITQGNGFGPLSFAWSNGDNQQTADSLVAGPYSVTVTDTRGCSIDFDFDLTQPNPVDLTCQTTANQTTFGGNGSILIDITGGNGPWFVRANGNFLRELTAADLPFTLDTLPGNYDFSVTDANGCTTAAPIACSARITELGCDPVTVGAHDRGRDLLRRQRRQHPAARRRRE